MNIIIKKKIICLIFTLLCISKLELSRKFTLDPGNNFNSFIISENILFPNIDIVKLFIKYINHEY